MDKLFAAAVKRIITLRMTEKEACAAAGMSYVTWWRARSGVSRNVNTRVKVLRQMEALLDRREGKVAMCGVCGRGCNDPVIAACVRSDCGLVEKVAA